MERRVQNWVLAGALALSAIGSASAQDKATTGGAAAPSATQGQGQVRFNGRYQAWQGTQPGNGSAGNEAATVPPDVSIFYPYAPTQNPEILRNMLQMRATSPRPNEFMGGAYNPSYRSNGYIRDRGYTYLHYGRYSDPYLWPGYGYGYGYAPVTGYVYGGSPIPPTPGWTPMPPATVITGPWGAYYVPQSPVIIQVRPGR